MSNFADAIATVIRVHEGGFQNRKDDMGNYTPDGVLKGTKYGISAHSFPNIDIENLTLNQAEDLYRQVWGLFGAIDDQRVLTKVLDLAVNMQWAGHGPATKILQRACNAVGYNLVVDGAFGPSTAAAANSYAKPDELLAQVVAQAKIYYDQAEANHPGMKAWFDNWNHRALWLPPEETSSAPVAV